MPPKDITPVTLKDISSKRIMNRQILVSDYKKSINELLTLMPELERSLPSSGTVFVGNSAYPQVSQEALLTHGLQTIAQLDNKYAKLIREDLLKERLDDIIVDANGNIHHSSPGSTTTTTTEEEEEEPAIDPAIAELRNQGAQFARQLIGLGWFTYTMPFTNYKISSINLSPSVTKQFQVIRKDVEMSRGFDQELWQYHAGTSYENSLRWRNVFLKLGAGSVTTKINEAISFGPFTGLSVSDINGAPSLSKRTDDEKVIFHLEQLAQGITNVSEPTNNEKDATAGSAIKALLQADWDHDFFLTKINMTHEQTQLFGKGCKFLGPWLIDQGRKMQQNAGSSDSDSDTASQIVGTILVVCGTILQYLGQQILNCDKGNGIRLLTNFWAGFLCTGVPIVWPQSR